MQNENQTWSHTRDVELDDETVAGGHLRRSNRNPEEEA